MEAPNAARRIVRDENPDESKIHRDETNRLAVSTMWVAKDLNEFSYDLRKRTN